ncbi:MAG: BadF/BadG/BcrA/BcrD ATPase family protein [Albidovulum sp.]
MAAVRNTLLIGVDGGGTGCRVAIADQNQHVLATAEGGRANVATDFELAIKNIRETMERAAQSANLSPDVLAKATVYMGLAGAVTNDVSARVEAAFGYDRVTVTDDRPTAMEGGLAGEDGFVVAVGTGTFIGCRRYGNNTYVGGYGLYVSDQASGAWLGKRLLELTLLSYDGARPHTDLTLTTLTKFGGDPHQIAAFSISAKPGEYGRLAPDVVSAAQSGDAVGAAILDEGFAYLEAGLNALGYRPVDTLCLTGGLGQHYVDQFKAKGITNIIAPRCSSVIGAVRLAGRAAQLTSTIPDQAS